MGRPRKGGEMSDAEKTRIITLYGSHNLTTGQLAARFGYSRGAVRKVLVSAGIKPAGRAEAES